MRKKIFPLKIYMIWFPYNFLRQIIFLYLKSHSKKNCLLKGAEVDLVRKAEEEEQPGQVGQKIGDQVVVGHVVAVKLEPLHIVRAYLFGENKNQWKFICFYGRSSMPIQWIFD